MPDTRARTRLAGVGAITATAMFAAALIPAGAATAATEPAHYGHATGQYIGIPDSLLSGLSTEQIAVLKGTTAANGTADRPVGTPVYVVKQPVDAALLSSIPLQLDGINLGGDALGDIIDLGAVTQYSAATSVGSSVGYAGTVGDMQGALTLGDQYRIQSWSTEDPAARINLGTEALSINASIGALYALARDNQYLKTKIHTASYGIAGVDLTVGGETLSGVLSTLDGLLTTLGLDIEETGLIDADAGTIKVSIDDILEKAGVTSINELPPHTNLLADLPEILVETIDGTVTNLLGQLPTGGLDILLQPVLDQVTNLLDGLSGSLLSPLTNELEGLLALYVNNVTDQGGVIKVSALEVNIGNGALVLPIATATAGKNTQPSLTAPKPSIKGTHAVGQTLVAVRGSGWMPADWTLTKENITFKYQWTADGKDIPGATNGHLKVTPDLVGKVINFKVTGSFINIKAATGTTTNTTKVVENKLTNSVAPKISGTAAVGKKLTASMGTWSPSGVTFVTQWHVGGKHVSSATTYTVKASDKGKQIKLVWAAKKAGYTTVKGETAAVTVK